MTLMPMANGKKPIMHTLVVDETVFGTLVRIADQEHQSVNELASELLAQAIDQRQQTDTAQKRWRDLSRREQEVIALYCLGYTSNEIGKRFTLSANTIKSHVHNAMQKFGVSSRGELRGKLADWDFAKWLGVDPETLPGYQQGTLPLPGLTDQRSRRVE